MIDLCGVEIVHRCRSVIECGQEIINTDKKVISLNLQIDTDICSMYEYFEIFLNRMLMCRGAADLLGATFKLTANGAKVL